MTSKLLSTENITVDEFLIQLMNIESTSNHEDALADELIRYFKSTGWHVTEQQIADNKKRRNLLITHIPFETPGPKFIMSTHLDTVPPFIPPVTDGTLIKGRGANDAKAQLAAMIFAAQKIAKEEPTLVEHLGLLLVVGEEVDHIGMTVILNVEGKAAHSGYPELGDSAIEKLLDILYDIRNHQWPESDELGKTTVNIGIISGGQALNATAANASARLFFRVTTSTVDIYEQLKAIVANRAQIDLSLGKNEPVHLNAPPIDVDSCVVAFNTDFSYFNGKDRLKGGYLFGAGNITNAHSNDEYIRIDDLRKAMHYAVPCFPYGLLLIASDIVELVAYISIVMAYGVFSIEKFN